MFESYSIVLIRSHSGWTLREVQLTNNGLESHAERAQNVSYK